jgi:moderate conductance mechanosensitive channel
MTENLSRWTQILGARGLRLLVILVLAFVLVRLLKAFSSRLVEFAKNQSRTAQMREQQTRTVAGLLYSAGTAVIVILAFLAALPEFGFNIAPVAAIAGLASLAVGFGAQGVVRDVLNGFFIAFEDQFVVGDTVRINGETGRVEHLTLRRTVLRNDRGAMVTIPNGLIGQVSNLSRDWSQTMVDIEIPASEVVGRALLALEKVAADFRMDPDWSPALVDGPRILGVESLTLNGVNLRAQMRTASLRQDDVAREFRRRVKMAFEQSSIQSVNPQRIELVSPHDHAEVGKLD